MQVGLDQEGCGNALAWMVGAALTWTAVHMTCIVHYRG